METTHFPIATNSIKFLGITLNKKAKDLYGKNFKYLKKLKKISEDIRDGKFSQLMD